MAKTNKVKIIYKETRDGRKIAELRRGENGTGKVVTTVEYLNNFQSIQNTDGYMRLYARRNGLVIVHDD